MSKNTPQSNVRSARGPQRGSVRRQPVQIGTFDKVGDVSFGFPFDRTTLVAVVVGIAVIVMGYVVMSRGTSGDPAANDGIWNSPAAVTWGPVLLTVGYCVIVPWALGRRRRSNTPVSSQG